MWDYNIGLVRVTPFFKCLGYAKVRCRCWIMKSLSLLILPCRPSLPRPLAPRLVSRTFASASLAALSPLKVCW